MQAHSSTPEVHFSVDNYQIAATFANHDDTLLFNRMKSILMASYTEGDPHKKNGKIDKTKKIANTVRDGERHVP